MIAMFLAATAVAQADTPPAAAVALLSAVESGDAAAARATLANQAMIADSSSGRGRRSSVEALAEYGRGCRHADLVWDRDSARPENAVVTLNWTCPSRAPSQAFVWTAGPRVTWVQFGMPAPVSGTSE